MPYEAQLIKAQNEIETLRERIAQLEQRECLIRDALKPLLDAGFVVDDVLSTPPAKDFNATGIGQVVLPSQPVEGLPIPPVDDKTIIRSLDDILDELAKAKERIAQLEQRERLIRDALKPLLDAGFVVDDVLTTPPGKEEQ